MRKVFVVGSERPAPPPAVLAASPGAVKSWTVLAGVKTVEDFTEG